MALAIKLLVVATAFAVFISRLIAMRKGLSNRDWRPIPAKVLKAYIDESRDSESGEVTYSANIEYSYKVSGTIYTSSILSYSNTFGLSQEQAIKMLTGITMGREITAYYNPRSPSEAVVIQGHDEPSFVYLALAFVALLSVAWFAFGHTA